MLGKLNYIITPRNKALATDVGLFILRMCIGLLMAYSHGYGKIFKLFSGNEIQFPDPLGVGAFASLALVCFSEFICSLLLVIGYYTRLSLIPLIATMFVAFFIIHGGDPLHKKELALVYLATYVVLFLTGPGRFSIDHMFTKNR